MKGRVVGWFVGVDVDVDVDERLGLVSEVWVCVVWSQAQEVSHCTRSSTKPRSRFEGACLRSQ